MRPLTEPPAKSAATTPPHNRIRLTWQPVNWDHETTIQVAIQAKGDRTLVRFHQERLANATEREQQRSHWKQVMDDLLSN